MTAITAHAIIFAFFTILYKYFPGGFQNNFKRGDGSRKPADWLDVIYFSTATHTTVGYGDVVADSNLAKAAVSLHMLLVFTIVVLGIQI